jgi:hypothetical protein
MNQKGSSAEMPKAGTEKNSHASPQTKSTKTFNEIAEYLGAAFIRSFFEMMSTFGLGGTLILILVWFLNVNATETQKHEIIDKWIVMRDAGNVKTIGICITLLGVVIMVGQWKHYVKKLRLKDEEIKRLEAEKNAYKEANRKRKTKQEKKGCRK